MERVKRLLAGTGVFLQILWAIINLPIVLFWALISLLRTVIGLALICALGLLIYEFYTQYQARERPAQSRNMGGGEASRDRGLARKPWTGEPSRGADQRQSGRTRKTAGARRQVARRAKARYQIENGPRGTSRYRRGKRGT